MNSRLSFALATIGLFVAAPALPAETGQAAPDFTIKMFDGSKTRLDDYRGKVLVINYWATWCGPCKAEMPMMSRFHQRNKAKGFEIIGVVTRDSVPKYKLKKVEELLSYPLASSLKGKYGTIDGAVPTTYIIDRKGQVRHAKAGAFSETEFNRLILPLLAEQP